MDRERWDKIQELFHQAIILPPSERRAFLQSACGGDQGLMDDVQAMVEADSSEELPLSGGLLPLVASLLGQSSSPLRDNDFGRYIILRRIGQGGMGVVYLARRADIGNVVAIKLLLGGLLTQDRRERFAEEQRTLGKLDHASIAQIFDADTLEDGTPWFAMEYVDGKPITHYCRDKASSVYDRLRLFRLVCEAVRYAHRQAIIHRDLKPSNILVKDDGTVKLLDFGIAKQLGGTEQSIEQTETGLNPMTLPYASPEQVSGKRLDTQSDVYSLGVILYELLTGRLPFDFSQRSRAEAEQMIIEREPAPPSVAARQMAANLSGHPPSLQLSKSTWPELDVLTATAMHKDLQKRYASAEALIRDLDHFLQGQPLEALPDSLGYRVRKFTGRHRRAISTAAAVGTIILALSVFFVARLNRARTAALAEVARTQRIERFMLNLFDGGDKSAGPSDSLKVVSLLDRGFENARTLNSDPVVQAELYQTLGGIYQKLGQFDPAERALTLSLERRKAMAGSDSHEAADALVALGLLRLDQGKNEEAERLIREGLAINRRHLSPEDPAVLRSEYALGSVLLDRGAYADAVKILEETMQRQSAQGATPELSDTITQLATAHYYLGHLGISERLNKQALALRRELYGSVHPRVADNLYQLGLIQHDQNHDVEAEKYYRQALAIRTAWYTKEHAETALMMAAVGQSLIYQGKYDEAAPILQEALAIQERKLGKNHPQVAMGLNTLGLLELRRKNFSDAERDFQRMADINRAAYDDRHLLVGVALLNLGEVYIQENDTPRAERFYREALSRFDEKLPPGNINSAITQARLGHALVLERRYKEAEGHLLAGYGVLAKEPAAQAARIQNTRKDLVTTYEAMNRPDEARKFRAEVAAGSSPSPSNPVPH